MKQFQRLYSHEPPKGSREMPALAEIADAHAREVWGEEIARGQPFPVCGADGNVSAYVFPYARGTRSFPSGALASEDQISQPETSGQVQFGAVYVAAQEPGFPVLRITNSLHPLYQRGDQAELIGRTAFGTGQASLSRIYWLGLHQEYFEVSTEGRRLLLDVHNLKQVPADKALQPQTAPKGNVGEIQPILPPSSPLVAIVPGGAHLGGSVLKLVPLPECVPVVDWSYWCVPTANTMVVCYYDNYIKKTGGIMGYGRLVGYWLEHLELHNGAAHYTNIPDYLNQLIDPQAKPEPNWRAGFTSFADFISKTYGYAFTSREVAVNSANDWAWNEITAEIDAGRPFVWTKPGHAVCAFGYRIACDGSKRVVIYNTWGATAQQQREEWLYTIGDGMTAITPGGGTDGQGLVLWSPEAGANLLANVPTTIGWQVWGDAIKTAEVSVSSDAGSTWKTIRQAAPCAPGANLCDWTPDTISDRTRVRVRGLDGSDVYIAGDGSRANLKVLQGPRPVNLKTILIKTETDGSGSFTAPHGLERYTPDGYAIRAISVAVQHKNGNWHTLEKSMDIDNRFWWNKEVVAGMIACADFFHQPVQIVVFAEAVVG